MEKKTVAVLFGGCSSEYEVSLQSAYWVIRSLNRDQYEVIMLGITREGAWLKYDGSAELIKNNTWMNQSCTPAVISPDRHTRGIVTFQEGHWTSVPVDVVFPVLHGKNGEDGTVQGLLDLAGIPCIGCGTLSSALCMDKDIAHKLVSLAGIRTPTSVVLESRSALEFSGCIDNWLEQACSLQYPLFVKPVKSGSSLGVSRVTDKSTLVDAVATAFQHDSKVIIEEAIQGFEVGCAILGNDELVIGELDEIELCRGFFDYKEKYHLETSTIHMPARIDQATAMSIKETAIEIYRILQCSGFARVDMFLTPDKEIVFNEVNTIPGFTPHSRYPNMLQGVGITFEGMVDHLIRLAMNR